MKWALFVACMVALAYTLPQKPWADLQSQLGLLRQHWPVVVLVSFLCPLNWALEALKWQMVAQNYKHLSFKEAYLGVLTGLGIGALVPQWLGDFVGRTWRQQHQQRNQQLQALPALWLGNFAAFQVTHFFGLAGLGYLLTQVQVSLKQPVLYLVATGCLLVLTLSIYYRIQWYAQPVLRLKALGKWRNALANSIAFSDAIRTRTLVVALARYAVFFGQWWLLLSLVNPADGATLAAAIALIFSLKSALPTLNLLGDLGIREYMAVVVLQWLGWQSTQVIPLTLTIWVINVLVPTLVGIVLLLPLFAPKPAA